MLDLRRARWRPRVVPNHGCIVTHLHNVAYGVRGEQVEARWAIAARGRERAATGEQLPR